jgi:hypothetical protein
MLAGDEADKAYQNDVVSREALIQLNRPENTPLAIALRTNASVTSDQLNSGRLFTGRTSEFAPTVFRAILGDQNAASLDPGKIARLDFPGGFSIPEEATLFASQNTAFEFGNPAAPSTQSSFGNRPLVFLPINSGAFVFLSSKDIQINRQVEIHPTDADLSFIAGGSILFKPNASLTVDAPNVFVGAYGDGLLKYLQSGKLPDKGGELLLDGSSSVIENFFESSKTSTRGTLTIFAPEITLLNGARFSSTGDLNVIAGGDISVQGPPGLSRQVTGPGGPVEVIDYSLSLSANSVTGSLQVRTDGVLSLTRTALFANRTALEAQTINLSGVNFQPSTRIDLKSGAGQANFGTSKPGHVNFIKNVFYGDSKIDSKSALNGTRSGSNGIYVSKK